MRKDKWKPKATPKEIPYWLVSLPKNALITHNEFASALGLTPDGLAKRLRHDLAPKRCVFIFKKCGRSGIEQTPKHYWKAYIVRNYIRKLIKESKNEV